jgi:type III pantothenate kinase
MKLLVVDIGNTRTKWALADKAGKLSVTEACLNADIAKFSLAQVAQQVNRALIANVAGEAMAHQVTQLLAPLDVYFVTAKAQACGVTNRYSPTLGADRWAALAAAWHSTQQATVVVNAGTAVTIDAVTSDGIFLGGTIMPGLHLMRESLSNNAAQLKVGEGVFADFPQNTPDAIATGSLNAAAGAIHLMLKRLEKQWGSAPKLVMSGGDAHVIAHALNLDVKQVIIIENLVLQGLVLLEKEFQ